MSLCLTCISVSFYICVSISHRVCLTLYLSDPPPMLPFRRSVIPTLCDPMDCSTPGFPVLHYLLELSPSSHTLSLFPGSSLSFSLCSSSLSPQRPPPPSTGPLTPGHSQGSPWALTHSPLPGWAGLAGGALIPVLPAESSGQGVGSLQEGGQLLHA